MGVAGPLLGVAAAAPCACNGPPGGNEKASNKRLVFYIGRRLTCASAFESSGLCSEVEGEFPWVDLEPHRGFDTDL